MDWITILILFVFLFLPLIQQLIEHSRKGQRPPAEEGGVEESEGDWEGDWEVIDAAEVSTPERADSRMGQSADESGWSSDWGSWPGAEEEIPRERTVERPRAERVEEWIPEPARPEPVTLPPVPKAPQRTSEIARIRRAERTADRLAARPAPSRLRRETAPVLKREAPSLASYLADPNAVRTAIVLNEVLGPPVSLRSAQPTPASPPPTR